MFSNKLLKSTVCSIEGRLMEGWTRARTREGQLYYLNHNHRISQWDHPEYIKIMNDLIPINSVRYAAYRTALKLRHLQKQTKCHEIPLKNAVSAFDSAGLSSLENCKMVSINEIERIILHIYRSSFKNQTVDVSLCTDIMLNAISNSFDESRTGLVEVLKCKIFLTVMCEGRLQEKYRYLFSQISDNDNFVTRRKLAKLLHSLASVTELVSEHLSFGLKLVPAAVESCFKDIYGDIGITEDIFLDWLLQEPQTLVWWSTHYRISSSELVCHDMKCASCKKKPIVGLRYQCLKCLGYNMCQDCFFHDRTSKKHKISHPIEEYCHEPTGKEWKKSFVNMINYKIRKSNTDVKPRYLTISTSLAEHSLKSLLQDSDDVENSESKNTENANKVESNKNNVELFDTSLLSRTISQSLRDLDEADGAMSSSSSSSSSCSSVRSIAEPIFVRSSPRREINAVIQNLEKGQRKLHELPDLKNFEVEEYKAELQTQINKLKTILQTCSGFPAIPKMKFAINNVVESTPIVPDRILNLSLSPIGGVNNVSELEVLDNQENHYNESNSHISPSFLSSLSMHATCDPTLTSLYGNDQNVSENRGNCILMKNNRKILRFSEMNLSDLSIESPVSLNVPSFEFRTLRDSEIDLGGPGCNKRRDELEAERKLQTCLTYLGKEFSKVVSGNQGTFPSSTLVGGTEEVLDSVDNILDLLRMRNSA